MTWSLSFLVSWFPIMKGQLETHGMELKSVFEEPGVLGSPLSNCTNSQKVVIVSPKANVPPGVSETT